MSDRLGEMTASASLAALAVAACVGSWRLGLGDVHNPGAGFMPFATAALLGLMALARLAWLALPGAGPAAHPFALSRWPQVLIVLATLAAFGAAVEHAGFALSTFLLLLILLGVVARKRWWIALLAALLVAAAARALFGALGLQLPTGPLGL